MALPALISAELQRSLTIQRRVLHALLMREVITRFGRHNLGALWLVAEPMLFTLGIVTLWTAVGLAHGTGIPVAAFAVTGYSSVLVWRNTVTRSNSAIQQNLNLLFHRNVRVIDVFVTRIVLEVAGATGSFLVLSLFFITIGWIEPPVDPLEVAGGWLLLVWFGASLALVIGGLTAFSDLVERIWHPLAYLLFPLSGAAFMVDWLPASIRPVAMLLPMVHGVEIVREGYFGNIVHFHYDVAYMMAVCLVLTLVGLVCVREAGYRVEAQ
jgi:ABC-type polysaccharide/polyol phosphate export permease